MYLHACVGMDVLKTTHSNLPYDDSNLLAILPCLTPRVRFFAKARTNRRDALPAPSDLAFYANIPPCGAGRCAECMALVAVTMLVRPIHFGGTVDCQKRSRKSGYFQRCCSVLAGNVRLLIFVLTTSGQLTWINDVEAGNRMVRQFISAFEVEDAKPSIIVLEGEPIFSGG